MAIEIKKVWEGRMGFEQRPVFEAYVDGRLVAFHSLKWLATAVAKAVEAGHIPATGDTVLAYAKWAIHNDRANYDRMPERI